MRRATKYGTLCLCLLLALAACTSSLIERAIPATVEATMSPKAVEELFTAQLHDAGLNITSMGEATQPFLRGHGSRLRLNGGSLATPAELTIYCYTDVAIAAEDAGRVQPDTTIKWSEPDGNVKTISYAWVAPPHFFRRDTTFVLYTGNDNAVLAVLTDILGPQFAGHPE